jgi:hypothetical protein
MPIYLGYPVTIREAYRILRIDVEYHISKYYVSHLSNTFIDNNLIEDVDNYLLQLLQKYIKANNNKLNKSNKSNNNNNNNNNNFNFNNFNNFNKINIYKTQNKQCMIGYEIENDIKQVESNWKNKPNTLDLIYLLNRLECELERELEILNADLSEVLLEEPYKGLDIDKVKYPKPYIVTI